MSQSILLERFFEILINGDRPGARTLIAEALDEGSPPDKVITDLFWPTYQSIEKLYRSDKLPKLNHHLATRLLRVLVDQNAARLGRSTSRGRRVFALCGPRDSDELGAQMVVDLMESAGFEVAFAGGQIPNDEIVKQVNETQPDVLVMFASGATDLPEIRALITTLEEIGACPNLQVAVGGGVFARADGLAEEIGADIWAHSPLELLDRMVNEPDVRAEPEQRTVGRKRKRAAAA